MRAPEPRLKPLVVEADESCGNVFADLGLPNPEERLAKGLLILHIQRIMKRDHLTQTQAAGRMGITQPALSSLLRGDVRGFSLDRLFRCLRAMDQDVQILVGPKEGEDASLSVILAPEDDEEVLLAAAAASSPAAIGHVLGAANATSVPKPSPIHRPHLPRLQ